MYLHMSTKLHKLHRVQESAYAPLHCTLSQACLCLAVEMGVFLSGTQGAPLEVNIGYKMYVHACT